MRPTIRLRPTALASCLCILLLPALTACGEPTPPAPVVRLQAEGAGEARAPGAATDAGAADLPRGDASLAGRRLAYLEHSYRQLQRLERGIRRLGPQRDGSAALAAAALAVRGRGGGEDAVRWTRRLLEECGDRWGKNNCERASLDLQRLVLQAPDALPEELRREARRQAALSPPPPPPDQVERPWGFGQTENQRMVTLARALGAHAVAGTGASPAARTWARHAEALLAARDGQGWYEQHSPGYLGLSVTALLHLRDLAPQPAVRDLAGRALHLLFARWAELQVGGMPAGPQTRSYVHWALGSKNVPWPAWAWYAAGVGDPERIAFGDWPEIALSGYEFPAPVRELLADRAALGTYEVRERLQAHPAGRRAVDAATYSYATPDYVLSVAQSVAGLELAVSGGQEVQAALHPEGEGFAPLYLWSRTDNPRGERWRIRAVQERAAAHENVALARLGTPEEPGHAYLASGWSRPEPAGDDVLVARRGDTFVALVTAGGWEVAPAPERFAALYAGDRTFAGSWVAIPRRQPAAIALEAARAADVGSFAQWSERAGKLRLEVDRADSGEPTRLTYRAVGGEEMVYRPGDSLQVAGKAVAARDYPLHASPFLNREDGGWRFAKGEVSVELPALPVRGKSENGPR
ncbi:MAG TPA: hypothetical protein VHQ65_15525 [Thermoanaerobaculia bacterium]|nr:hypothetical protein [Thermoanaerobaculia bacterium]